MLSLRCSESPTSLLSEAFVGCHFSVGNDSRISHRLIDLTEAKDLRNTISYDSKLRSQDVQYSPCLRLSTKVCHWKWRDPQKAYLGLAP